MAGLERRKIWKKVTVRVHDEVSSLTPIKNISKEGKSQNKEVDFASPNLSSIELNVGGSCISKISSITASPSFKNTSPALKRFRLSSSLLEEYEGSKDEKVQAMNIIKAIEELEEKKKLLLDAAKKNCHVGEILKSTKRKFADY